MARKKSKKYLDRHDLYEGAVVLFSRADSWKRGNDRIWQARFKLDGMTGYKRVSLKTPIYDAAYAKARDLYLHFQEMVREGSSLRDRTFAQAWPMDIGLGGNAIGKMVRA